MKRLLLASALLGALALPASALTLGNIPEGATNEALGPLGLSNPLSGYYGANLYLSSSGPVAITATILGYEAGAQNTFSFGTDSYTSPGGMSFNPAGLDSWVVMADPGLLDFSFLTNLGPSVANGSNPDHADATGVDFFVSFIHDPLAKSGQGVYLFFNDNGAADDDNHDDLVVKLTIRGGTFGSEPPAPVPLPAAGLLLVGAMGGLAALRRRKG